MGRYCELAPTGYLARWKDHGLDPARKALAERTADRLVDDYFDEWDRGGWQGEMVPEGIRAAATKIAEGEYWLLSMGANSAAIEETTGGQLRRQGERELDAIKKRGGPMLADGTRQEQAPEEDDGFGNDLFVRVVR